jgi:hypothetical protein
VFSQLARAVKYSHVFGPCAKYRISCSAGSSMPGACCEQLAGFLSIRRTWPMAPQRLIDNKKFSDRLPAQGVAPCIQVQTSTWCQRF